MSIVKRPSSLNNLMNEIYSMILWEFTQTHSQVDISFNTMQTTLHYKFDLFFKPLDLPYRVPLHLRSSQAGQRISTTCIVFQTNWNIKHENMWRTHSKSKFIKMLKFLPEFQLKHHRPIFGSLLWLALASVLLLWEFFSWNWTFDVLVWTSTST